MQRSAQWLADHFTEVPLFLFPFCQYDPTGGSISPPCGVPCWPPGRRGSGSCLTALLRDFHPTETLEILGVPTDQGWKLAGVVPFGYPTGRWGVAPRRPVDQVSYRNSWGSYLGFEVPEPLWKG